MSLPERFEALKLRFGAAARLGQRHHSDRPAGPQVGDGLPDLRLSETPGGPLARKASATASPRHASCSGSQSIRAATRQRELREAHRLFTEIEAPIRAAEVEELGL
jgi:hypothetical protein